MQVVTNTGSMKEDGQHSSSRWLPILLWTAGAVTLLKIILALCTYGTNDVYTYQETAIWGKALGVQIYRTGLTHGAFMNHPPSMLHVLSVMNWLAQVTGIAFPFWLRLPAILADSGSVWLVWKLMGERLAQRSTAWSLLIMTAAPVSIMVSGFHGQTDGLLVFLVLMAVYLAEMRASGWVVGAVFGLSLCVKVAPIVAVSAIFLYQSGLRRRLEFVIATVLVPLIAWEPFLYEAPGPIIHNVLGYQGSSGSWGLGYLATYLSQWLPLFAWLPGALRSAGAYVIFAVCAAAAVYLNSLPQRPRLYAQVGFMFFVLLTLSTGFGVQYLAWLVPWAVELGAIPAAIHFAAGGLFLFSVYNFWAEGLPWYLADSNRIGAWGGYIDLFQLLTWETVVLLAWLAWRRMVPRTQLSTDAGEPAAAIQSWGIVAGLGAGLVFFAVTQWSALQHDGAGLHAAEGPSAIAIIQEQSNQALAAQLRSLGREQALEKSVEYPLRSSAAANPGDLVAARQFLNLSLQMYNEGRFQESVVAAKEAIKRKPDMAEAYNNLGAAYNNLHQWDDAIQAEQEAIRLKPDFQLARNNLAYSMEQKRLQK